MSVKKTQLKKQQKGNGKGGSNGFSKGGQQGGWVFIPAMGGKGKGFGKQNFANAFMPMLAGKGFGKSEKDMRHSKVMDKLGKIEADRKVWVGGLKKETTWGKLEKHFKELDCKPSTTEIMSKGTACCAFKTADEASTAIATVNGSELDGQTIEVDVWTQKEKKEKKQTEPGEKPKKKLSAGKAAKKSAKKQAELAEKIAATDSALKVLVGGLKPNTTWEKVKQHFVDNGCEIKLCIISKPGSASVTFETAEEATSAIAILDGTDLDGKTIVVKEA